MKGTKSQPANVFTYYLCMMLMNEHTRSGHMWTKSIVTPLSSNVPNRLLVKLRDLCYQISSSTALSMREDTQNDRRPCLAMTNAQRPCRNFHWTIQSRNQLCEQCDSQYKDDLANIAALALPRPSDDSFKLCKTAYYDVTHGAIRWQDSSYSGLNPIL